MIEMNTITPPQKRRLGRGLAALIGEDTAQDPGIPDTRALRSIPIEQIRANPNNPRKRFHETELEELAESIRQKGVLQPLLVRRAPSGLDYELVAGERRWRAAQRAGIHTVPVLVRDLTDGEALEIAIIENVQRTDLNALEEALAYQQLMDQFSYTQNQLSGIIGKSRSHIANTLRLLTLSEGVRQHLESGALTAGHARALLGADQADKLAERIVRDGLSVRQTEDMVRDGGALAESGNASGLETKSRPEKTPDIKDIEKRLREATGLKITIRDKGAKGGTLELSYRTLDQLDEMIRRLGA